MRRANFSAMDVKCGMLKPLATNILGVVDKDCRVVVFKVMSSFLSFFQAAEL
jgi:hypothetical protein